MAEERDRKRELPLPPGTYAYIMDTTKGQVKLYAGPVVINQTGQDRPVIFNHSTHKFEECTLETALQQNIVVPEGFYAVLTNPAKTKDGKQLVYPESGRAQDFPDLSIGLKENIPGPVNFALFPGQTCEIRRGHHLRSNEYLLVKIYNEDKARENWSKAIIKRADPSTAASTTPADETVATRQAPKDLSVGKQYNILGTEVSFYIPPTGVSVVPEGHDSEDKVIFVRAAETLEQLEYSILVDEDGNKQYPRGPAVVFPKPTQRFLTDRQLNRKFRAIEMNELQGIQLKFISNVEMTYVDGTKHKFVAGEEVFITGKEMPIYYPEEGHQIVRYDGKSIHYAVAIPEGEARYVMNRKTGEIRTVRGPGMLLPNPVTEIIVRRALSDFESTTWFPGADGKGSKESLEYNRWLRAEAAKEPTTRQGVVSEGRVEGPQAAGVGAVGASADMAFMNYAGSPGLGDAEVFAEAASSRGVAPRRMLKAKGSYVPESRQGKEQQAMAGDVAERKSTFNEPRTITFASKYKGVPTIKVQPGYAVNVVNTSGDRQAVVGPRTILLEYGQTLDVLALSTGKPKNTDALHRTAYLNIYNNKITDIMEVETQDLVKVSLKLSYNVNFEGDAQMWFHIENYVKHLCDHIRSILKGKIRKVTIEEFYTNSTDFIRDTLLGVAIAASPKDADSAAVQRTRPGLLFKENGMRVTDVEVLQVAIIDQTIGQLLAQTQHQVVQQNIQLAQARRDLVVTKEQQTLERDKAEAVAATQKRKFELAAEQIVDQVKVKLVELDGQKQQHIEAQKVEQEKQKTLDVSHAAGLERDKAKRDQDASFLEQEQERAIQMLQQQTQSVVDQVKAIDPVLAAALESASARETLVQVAKSLSIQQLMGTENAAELLQKVFANTPLGGLIAKAMDASGKTLNGNGKSLPSTPPA